MNGAIGVFDSGIGGLTVLKELAAQMPAEDTIYLGDTARVPYGNKSADTVTRYALEIADFLTGHGIKMLVVACNTASAFAVDRLAATLDIPVVGVIEPGARAAVAATRCGHIGVIGTEGTIKSGAYARAVELISPGARTTSTPCPLFVPLVEQGWLVDEITVMVARRYLAGMITAGVDTLVLGCTHYPLLKETISGVMGPDVALIDSAEATAAEVRRVLEARGIARPPAEGSKPVRRFFVTDSPERFVSVGGVFFGSEVAGVEHIELECRL